MSTQMRYASVIGCLIVIAIMFVIDDSAITTKVKSALIADPEVKGTQVQVEVHLGVVH